MAQLPPKIPSIVAQDHHHDHNPHQWLEFDHDSHPPQQEGHHNPSWVDEFMEFSAAKRGAHRRSVSDSNVAFIDGGVLGSTTSFRALETDGDNKGVQNNHDHEQFEKLDDEQLMSMFSSNEPGSCSNQTSTSDHSSTNEDQGRTARPGWGGTREERERVEEVDSSSKGGDKEGGQAGIGGTKGGVAAVHVAEATDNVGGGDQQPAVVDPKRVKRILANRQSAQRSRVRKLQYISELERSVTALQSEVSVLSPQVAFLDHQRMILRADNSALKAKIAALAQDKIFKDAHQEALKREIERLRQVYYQQSLKKTTDVTITSPSFSPLPSPAIQFPQPDIKDNET